MPNVFQTHFWAHIWYLSATDLANNRECNVVSGMGGRGGGGSDTIVLIFRQTPLSPVTPQDNVSRAKLSKKSQDQFVQKQDTVTQSPQFETRNYNEDKRLTIANILKEISPSPFG